ncbi:MAG: globin [Deltaproteobacteria bacterium]|nr:globin [Deltaproteobacteria bacterium]
MRTILKSFHRALNKGLPETFYAIFLEHDDRIRELFKNTDFKKQRDLFVHGVLMLIEFADGKAMGLMAMQRLGESHSRKKLNVTPDLYPIWVDSMMEALAKLDPEFTPELERQWRQALRKGIDLLIKMN